MGSFAKSEGCAGALGLPETLVLIPMVEDSSTFEK